MTTPPAALQLVKVDRTFGATHAVKALDLVLHPGTVHSLVGENGAGKSTAGKIAAGVLAPTAGHVEVGGEARTYRSARDAELDGVVLVPQELLLYDTLTVEENLFAGRRRPRSGATLDSRRMRELAAEALERLGLELDLRAGVASLSPGMKQMVTITRALVNDARVLVLDEPTAALDEWEAQRLLEVVDGLRAENVAVLYVSHRLHEVMAVSDHVTVLRDGAMVSSAPVSELDAAGLVELMVGREVLAQRRTSSSATKQVALATRSLSRTGEFEDVSLQVRCGEIVGLAGIVGAGRSELGQVLGGVHRRTSGSVQLMGAPVSFSDVRSAVRHGLAYLPEERQSQGLFMPASVEDNISASSLGAVSTYGVVRRRAVRDLARTWLRDLSLRGGLEDSVDSLSGGNQQKVLLAKWLATEPTVMILDEPTRGIDVGARSEIYALIERLADDGCAVLLISSDLQELMLLSDRVLVMREGRLVRELAGEELTELNVGAAALGMDADSVVADIDLDAVTL